MLLNGGKLAGILLESSGLGQGPIRSLCIGIGVNLIAAPMPPARRTRRHVPPVSLLAETGKRVTPDAFLDALAPAYAIWEATFTGPRLRRPSAPPGWPMPPGRER